MKNGFSLIEMMVVLTIFGIMTAVVLANFPAFRDKTALDLIAQEIATTIRQAQVYGIGTRAAGAGGAAQFSSHGIYLAVDGSNGLDKKSFYLYAEKTGGSVGYDSNDFKIEQFAIRGGAEINKLCADSVCSFTELNILFKRPYPEANFITNPNGTYGYVKIVIKSTRTGAERTIQIWNTGQIVVTTPP